jgi:hypothetical protein
MSGTSLEDIFSNSEVAEADPPEQVTEDAKSEAPVEAVEADPQEPETGDDPPPAELEKEAAQADDDPGAPPAPEEEIPSGHVPRAALEDERRKRQEAQTASKELEDRIAELEKQLTAPPSQPAPQPQPQTPQVPPVAPPQQPIQPPPDPWTDPEGALAHERFVNQKNLMDMRISFGQDMMRSANPDYDEVEAVFIAEAQRDPVLAMQMMQAPNPAKYAYEKGRQFKLMNEIGSDPAAYEQSLRDKIMEELKATQAAEAAAQAQETPPPQPPATPPAPPPPTSLAGVPSSAPRQANNVQWEGPTPLDKVLG